MSDFEMHFRRLLGATWSPKAPRTRARNEGETLR